MKILLPTNISIIVLLLSIAAGAESTERKWPGEETQVAPTQTQPQVQPARIAAAKNTAAYLGIGVDILPQSVVAQMPPGVSTGEGILVTRFGKDSPAEKSGLRAFDILLSYDKTKLIHPKQFIEIVQKDQPGREIILKVLRNGNVISHPITLGMQDIPKPPNGLAIKQLGKNDYQANIRFTDINGNQQLRQYRGTREQIYYQALNARDLPEKDRQQILYAAGGPKNSKSKSGWSSMFPFGNNNNGNNSWGSMFPFGNKNNGNDSKWGSWFPFNR